MSSLTLRQKTTPPRHLDLFGIVPNRLSDLPLREILRLPIRVGENDAVIGDCFEVIEGARTSLTFEGDLSNCDYVGGGLENGQIRVTGNVGDFLADRMRGGSIEVQGSANRFACSGLRGGLVRVAVDCGEHAAAAAPGEKRGMNGGVLVIGGNCDQWLATRMRRGTVIVHGNVAPACASRMIAGTLVLCGDVELPLAANLARGTILLLSRCKVCTAPAGFTVPEHTELSYLQILINDIAAYLPEWVRSQQSPATTFCNPLFNSPVYRALGDRVNRGLGEIIWLNSQIEPSEQHFAHA
jgi:formylmethanofuran dehydrogenase subunit C